MAQFQDNQPTLSLYLASLLMCNLHLVNSSSIKDSSRNSFRVNLNNFRGSLNFRVNHNNFKVNLNSFKVNHNSSKGNNSTKDNLSNRDNLLGNHNKSRNQANLDHQSPCRPRSNLDLANLFLCRPSRVKLNLETSLEVKVMVIVYTTLLGLVAYKSQIQS